MTEIRYVIARQLGGVQQYLVYGEGDIWLDHTPSPGDAIKYVSLQSAQSAVDTFSLNTDVHYIKKITITVE